MKKVNVKTTDMTEEEKIIKKAKRVGFIKKVVLVVVGFIVFFSSSKFNIPFSSTEI